MDGGGVEEKGILFFYSRLLELLLEGAYTLVLLWLIRLGAHTGHLLDDLLHFR